MSKPCFSCVKAKKTVKRTEVFVGPTNSRSKTGFGSARISIEIFLLRALSSGQAADEVVDLNLNCLNLQNLLLTEIRNVHSHTFLAYRNHKREMVRDNHASIKP